MLIYIASHFFIIDIAIIGAVFKALHDRYKFNKAFKCLERNKLNDNCSN